ncbi:MAG: cation:proton antiporter [Muribaculaceae bacterium]|jgi:CPA2 family monovalent cation:H+ antiporter-2|nr:cation:proton antiporter [Muribaculaceae bacterium]
MESIDINSLISDLALILILGAIATVIFKMLKQPLVLGYIVAGFLASPNFALLPSVAVEANIEFWAQIGIIVLLFSLGLEFSFKKLIDVGGSAIITALIIVLGMMSLGFVVGKFLGYGLVNSIFLGGMISMSSTTIILKALTDLNMRQRRFVPMTFAVLIVEDLFAVVMMVILSSIALNNSVHGGEMLGSILKLSFFLIMWFTVGIFMIPTLFKRFKRYISDEQMLIIAMGLCFAMVLFSVNSGFSAALGAFVMGSILAGTIEAERIERLISSVKDLFGAVFFISVGMMVNPSVITQHWSVIALLAVVVIVGMIVFGTFGMLATGQPLKLAMESGFSLTQIGEFSFIIATLGTGLGVLDKSIYPIIVAVSVITTFTTPFFIKQAVPCYNALLKILPKNWTRLLEGYSQNATESESSETNRLWRSIGSRFITRLIIYSVVIFALIVMSRTYLMPFILKYMGENAWGRLTCVVVTLVIILPLIISVIMPVVKRSEKQQLVEASGSVSYVPIVVMAIISIVISLIFVMSVLNGVYSSAVSVVSAILLVAAAIFLISMLPTPVRRRISSIEKRFISNINERENRRTGHENNLVSDLHLAYMTVGHDCPFVGDRLRNLDLRTRYNINLVNIQRAGKLHPVPSGEMRLFPGDVLGVIGTEEQIQRLLPLVEAQGIRDESPNPEVKFTHFAITRNSPIVGVMLENTRLREDYGALLVAVQRGEDNYISPTPDLTFAAGDILWIVGNPKQLARLK